MISVRCAALAAVLGAGLGAAAGCSLLLDFGDPIEGAVDAAPPDASEAACGFGEPNDSVETAFALEAGSAGPAAICAQGADPDADFFGFQVDGTQDVTIRILFDAGDGSGDLKLNLYAADGTFLDNSGTIGDDERLDLSGAGRLAAGDYVFEVVGEQPSYTNVYDIELIVTSVLADAGT
jgi:hypothetical protein